MSAESSLCFQGRAKYAASSRCGWLQYHEGKPTLESARYAATGSASSIAATANARERRIFAADAARNAKKSDGRTNVNWEIMKYLAQNAKERAPSRPGRTTAPRAPS